MRLTKLEMLLHLLGCDLVGDVSFICFNSPRDNTIKHLVAADVIRVSIPHLVLL